MCDRAHLIDRQREHDLSLQWACGEYRATCHRRSQCAGSISNRGSSCPDRSCIEVSCRRLMDCWVGAAPEDADPQIVGARPHAVRLGEAQVGEARGVDTRSGSGAKNSKGRSSVVMVMPVRSSCRSVRRTSGRVAAQAVSPATRSSASDVRRTRSLMSRRLADFAGLCCSCRCARWQMSAGLSHYSHGRSGRRQQLSRGSHASSAAADASILLACVVICASACATRDSRTRVVRNYIDELLVRQRWQEWDDHDGRTPELQRTFPSGAMLFRRSRVFSIRHSATSA